MPSISCTLLLAFTIYFRCISMPDMKARSKVDHKLFPCLKEIACRKKAKYTLITFALFIPWGYLIRRQLMKKIKSFFLWQVTLTYFILKLFDIPAALLSHCCQASPTDVESLSKNHEDDFCQLLARTNLALHTYCRQNVLWKLIRIIHLSQNKEVRKNLKKIPTAK